MNLGIILFEKASEKSEAIANVLRSEYMKRYFGTNERIQHFAYQMLRDNRRDVALEINNVIRVLGTPSDNKIHSFLSKIRKKYSINRNNIDISDIHKIQISYTKNDKIFYIELKNEEVIATLDNKNYFIFEDSDQFNKNCTRISIHEYFNPTNLNETIKEFLNSTDIKLIPYYLEE